MKNWLGRLVEEERRAVRVLLDVVTRVWDDGFIHAGNLAYLSMLALFPFFIIVGTIAGFLGRSEDGIHAVEAFLQTLPPSVAKLLAEPIVAAIGGSAGIVTFSIAVGLWTAASYVETIRDILRRAYRANTTRPMWQRRLGSFALVIGSVMLMMIAFAAQVTIVGAEQFVEELLPWAGRAREVIDVGRVGPVIGLMVGLYLLFLSLTPIRYRNLGPKWPGAVVTSGVWIGATVLLPGILANVTTYDRFYGPLASVMITLLFFFIVGMGFVIGAELNAALALTNESRQKGARPAEQPKD
jgi:membrane protein